MINAEAIAKMKDGVIILNFARTGGIDDAMAGGPQPPGKVAWYVTDSCNGKTANMFTALPSPIWALPRRNPRQPRQMAVQELMDYLKTATSKNSVNYPNCDMGICRAEGITLLHRNIPNLWVGLMSPLQAKTSH